MFRNADMLDWSKIQNWDVSSLTEASYMFYGNLGTTASLCSWGTLFDNIADDDGAPTDGANVENMFTDSGCPETSSPVYDSATNTYSPLCHICDNNVP